MQLHFVGIVVLAFSLLASSLSSAHHGVADDIDLAIFSDLTGTIERVEWINPHVVIHLSVEDNNGFKQLWLIQAGSPNALLRVGINRRTIDNMTPVEIRVYPSVSSPCANECFGYGYQLLGSNGANYTLHADLHTLISGSL